MPKSVIFEARVERIRREAKDILSYELVPHGSEEFAAFTPGSHIDVHIAPGIVRQYSLFNGPTETSSYHIAVKLDAASRGGSVAMHDRVREGDVLKISAPRNNFPLDPTAPYQLLLAGGIGVTPVLSMARHLNAAGKPFHLQYFTRSIEHTAFHALLSGAEFRSKATFHYALEPEGLRAYLRKLLWNRPDGAHLYLCGPKPFMDAVETAAASSWPPESVHLEYFAADPMSLAGARNTFKVRLARSGGEFDVPENKTIIEALAEHGIAIDTSCEQGVCGTCLTGVLEGEPDHRDIYLNAEEKSACNKVIPCVSRSKSPILVLDL